MTDKDNPPLDDILRAISKQAIEEKLSSDEVAVRLSRVLNVSHRELCECDFLAIDFVRKLRGRLQHIAYMALEREVARRSDTQSEDQKAVIFNCMYARAEETAINEIARLTDDRMRKDEPCEGFNS